MTIGTTNRNEKILAEFAKKYLLTARRELSELNKQTSFFGCNEPCQVNIIWFEKPSVQIMTFTNLKEKPDMLIHISGPHYASEAKNVLEDVLKNSSWLKEYLNSLPENQRNIARRLIEMEFIIAIRNIQRLIERGELKKAIHRSTQELPAGGVVWFCEGFLPRMGVKGLCEHLGVTSHPSSTKNRRYSRGWGTFYYPPILLGSKPKLTFVEKVMRKRPRFLNKRNYVGTCAGYQVYVGKEGFVGLLCEEVSKAFAILNMIFAFSFVKGIDNLPVLPTELYDIRYSDDEQSFDMIGSPIASETLRTSRFQASSSFPITQTKKFNIRRDKIRQIISGVDKIISEKEVINCYCSFMLDRKIMKPSRLHA